MSLYEYTPDIADDMVDLAPALFKVGPTTTVHFLQAVARLIQPIEDSYHYLRGKLNLTEGRGFALDVIGSWLELTRDGDDDSQFLARILVQIVQNNTGGQREALIEILRILGGEGIKIWVLETGWIQITYSAPVEVLNEDQIAQILNFAVEPGEVIISSYTARPFRFAGRAPSGGGFGIGQLGVAGDCDCGGIEI